MKLVTVGNARINPDQVVDVVRVFWSNAYERDLKKYALFVTRLKESLDADERFDAQSLIDEEYPQGGPREKNYWATRVSMSNGKEHYTDKSVAAIEALLVG